MEAVFRQHSTWMYFAADPSVIITFTVSFRKYALLRQTRNRNRRKKSLKTYLIIIQIEESETKI